MTQALPKPRKRPVHHESRLQITCVRWFRLQYPQYAALLFAIPNGGKRGKAEAGIMSAEGVVAGVPDLQLAVPSKGFHGLFIEMKHGKNKPTHDQLTAHERLRAQGYAVSVCYSLEEFMQAVNGYLT